MHTCEPLVSVITVCFNERERIEATLSSVISQSYVNKEIIVIDGNSTDGTIEIIKNHCKDIDHLLIESDQGVYYAMNKGLKLARGEYVIFMNGGDEFYDKDVITQTFQLDNTSEDILYGNIAYVYPDGKRTISRLPAKLSNIFLTFNTICHQAMACKRELLVKYGGFDTSYRIAADYHFLIKAVLTGGATTRYLPLTFAYFYRDGLSHDGANKTFLSDERLTVQKTFMPTRYYLVSRLRRWIVDRRDRFPFNLLRSTGNRAFQVMLKPPERKG